MILDSVQRRNLSASRLIVDAWCDARPKLDREGIWVRLVAAELTESVFRILAHTGEWKSGGRINEAQKAILRTSAKLYRDATGREPDGYGSNGGSVGILQQIPTPVARAADDPWDGWGSIVDCMVLATSVPKFLAQIRVTDDSTYGGKPMASAIVADLLRVQRPLTSEVAANYGGAVTANAVAVAQQFPRTQERDWLDMATKEEVQQAFTDALSAVHTKLDAIQASLTTSEDRPRLSLVRNSQELLEDGSPNPDFGAIYAYGPGQFDHVGSMDELDFGRRIGMYTRSPWLDTDNAGIRVFRGIAIEGSGADKSKES